MDDGELLQQYADSQRENAFAELVRRHLDLVYSAALRQSGGNAQTAEDVAQVVFTELARKAGHLRGHPAITGWLYTTTRRKMGHFLRGESRRVRREQEASTMQQIHQDSQAEPDWERLRPVLDAAMDELGEADRLAVLLRFFEGRDFRTVGTALGLSENTARMRVDRALDKLQLLLKKRGVISTGSALAAMLSAQTITAAPAGLAAVITAGSLAASAATLATGALLTMASTKIKIGLVCVLIAGGTATLLLHREAEHLEAEIAPLKTAAADLQQLQAANTRLAPNRAAAAELARLQAAPEEIARLQQRKANLEEELRRRNQARTAQGTAGQHTNSSVELTAVHVMVAKSWGTALLRYAQQNDHKLPGRVGDATPFADEEDQGIQTEATSLGINAEDFEIVHTGPVATPRGSPELILLRERKAFLDNKGRLVRAYVFADGHSQAQPARNGDFSAFEREHGVQQ